MEFAKYILMGAMGLGVFATQNAIADGLHGEMKTHQVTENIHVLQIKGGNVGVFTGEDGVFLIDTDYKEATNDILSALEKISDKEIKYILNTHWHGDHTGGNQNLSSSGGAIVAHENVRNRLAQDNYIAAFDMQSKAAPESALPSITYHDKASFHINGITVDVFHVSNAHTDGDSVVHFKALNVIHAGDIFFNGFYPFIDTSSGGTLAGMLRGVDTILALADEKTVIIPGHGPISNKIELQDYRDMLAGVQAKLLPMKRAGKTLDDVRKTNPLDAYNAQWLSLIHI